jgi:hypothetical protein
MVTVSERRLEANRHNAARSAGPRTPEGMSVPSSQAAPACGVGQGSLPAPEAG